MNRWLDKFQDGGSKPDLQQHKSVPSNDRLNYQKPVVQDFVYDSNGKVITDSTIARATLRLRTNEQGNISKTVPRSKLKNAYDVAVHPFTSAQQLLANQPVTGRGPQNIYDFSLDAFPAMLAAKQLPQIPGNIQRGEYTQAGLNALTVLPFLPKIPKSIPKVFSEGQPYEGAPHIYTDYYPVNNVYQPRTVITDAGVKNEILGLEATPIIPLNQIEYPVTSNKFLYGPHSSFGRMEKGVVTDTYRGMPPGTNTYTSTLPSYTSFPNNNFKSEIDWGKWNKEIPDNKTLLDEYYTIEQTSKANGSWMKNPDGSLFQGTPEQFVQQNSENFKKAFGNSKLVNPDGSPAFQYHGGKKGYEQFLTPQDKGYIKRDSYTGDQGIYFTPSKSRGKSYTKNTPKDDRELYQTYVNMENPYTGKIKGTFGKDQITNEQYEELLRNEYDGIIDKNLFPYHRQTIVFDPKRIKSAVGNNGMFDMTNPNIYKAVVPGAIVLGALKQKQNGGPIITTRGQWDYPGQTTIIPSNNITMQGVPYPVVGVDNTGHTKMMHPGMNYTFPGQYVTEFPVMQNGGVKKNNRNWLEYLND